MAAAADLAAAARSRAAQSHFILRKERDEPAGAQFTFPRSSFLFGLRSQATDGEYPRSEWLIRSSVKPLGKYLHREA